MELRSLATAKNGMRFDNRYCWVVRFKDEIIVEVRAYLDSALVQTLIDHNGLGTEVFKGISPRSHGAREFTEDLDICLP